MKPFISTIVATISILFLSSCGGERVRPVEDATPSKNVETEPSKPSEPVVSPKSPSEAVLYGIDLPATYTSEKVEVPEFGQEDDLKLFARYWTKSEKEPNEAFYLRVYEKKSGETLKNWSASSGYLFTLDKPIQLAAGLTGYEHETTPFGARNEPTIVAATDRAVYVLFCEGQGEYLTYKGEKYFGFNQKGEEVTDTCRNFAKSVRFK